MAEVFKKRIIKYLRHADYRPVRLARLARALGIESEDYPQFKLAFDQLRQAGHVVIGSGNLISLPPVAGTVVGTFRANPKGFGFIVPRDPNLEGDLFVPADATAGAMSGDTVAAKVVKKGRRGRQMRLVGEIIEILERAESRFVGTLTKGSDGWFVQPDGAGFLEPISVDDVTAKNAKEKDKVVVEILSWPTEKYLARGVLIEVLGKAGRYESEIRSIVRQYHLREEFDNACLRQARKVAAEFDPERTDGRENATEKTVITIDPVDAKDFDDAISLEKESAGNWLLGIHIADVSRFVPAGSPLDEEARQRGNSVYLPGRTIPMLPEVLSNGICSLQPDQRRFTKSVYITYDNAANVIGVRFANSVIRSTQRLTYQQADKFLSGRTKGAKPGVVRLLKNMETLSRLIENRRMKNGMLRLELPETELIMDKAGRVIDAEPADDSYPHTMIEMFMVEANEAVARLLDRLNVSFLRRIHPEPHELSLRNLSRMIGAFGITIPRVPERADLQQLLEAVRGTDCSLAVNLAVLRSLEKAQYSALRMGHYALASSNYCHFTSPIRRYADLLVHRVLQCYLDKCLDSPPAGALPDEQNLNQTGSHLTFTEQRAEDAETELKTVLILQMLSSRIGDELDCVVTGLAGFGVFVRSCKFGIEGLIRLEDLGPDQWKFNQKAECVIGSASGVRVCLGQPLKVQIVSVNVSARQLNLAPREALVDVSKVGRAAGRETARRRKLKGRARRRR